MGERSTTATTRRDVTVNLEIFTCGETEQVLQSSDFLLSSILMNEFLVVLNLLTTSSKVLIFFFF